MIFNILRVTPTRHRFRFRVPYTAAGIIDQPNRNRQSSSVARNIIPIVVLWVHREIYYGENEVPEENTNLCGRTMKSTVKHLNLVET